MVDKALVSDSVERISNLLRTISLSHLGYPPGDNRVLPPVSLSTDLVGSLPPGLQVLYEICNGISMPDVYVGYFIHEASRVLSASARGEPHRIVGIAHEVLVFGSDGGGGRFSIGLDEKAEIYYLPSGGSVRQGTFAFISRKEEPVVVASGVDRFLERLLEDLRAFLAGSPHVYMAR